jgi:hypothetical protein
MFQATSTDSHRFTLGQFRALYLWGGPGTIRMTELKFMNKPVDEATHQFAHSLDGAERVAAMGFNWVFLVYNWGFPPEVEDSHWASFESALNHYHQVGIKVFGYIQASNCAFEGSYVEKDWYAEDAWGHKIPIYSNRYFTSLAHAGWLSEVRERVRKLTETGVDGIFFDNPWQGGIGIDVANMPLGFIGSYDTHSKNAYAAAYNGAEIPIVVDTQDTSTQQYLRWRVQIAAGALRDWSQTARDINPNIAIAANNFDPIVHNAYVAMGMDLDNLADVQDVMMIENFSLPRIQDDGSVVANAVTIDAARSRSHPTPVTTLPYINGIGFDRVFQARQLRRMLAEGAALNSPTLVRGSTFLYRGIYTTILHKRYDKQHTALREMNSWLEQHREWLADRKRLGKIAIYHPYEAVRWRWNRIAPIFFAACQTLIQNGYPLRIVGDDDEWEGIHTLIVPPGDVEGLEQNLQRFVANGGKVIALQQPRSITDNVALWRKWRPIPHRIPRIQRLRKAINQGASLSWRAYHRWRWIRWIAERFDLHLQTTRSPLFFSPPEKYTQSLLRSLDHTIQPHINSEYPVLLCGWQEPNGTQQWHIVNYADVPQKVTLDMQQLVRAKVYTVGSQEPPIELVGSALILTVDVARVVRIVPD